MRTFGAVKGKIGEVVEARRDGRLVITAQGGRIHAGKAKLGDGKKLAAADLVASGAIKRRPTPRQLISPLARCPRRAAGGRVRA